MRAARDLRAMLDCEGLALAGADGVLAIDGPDALRGVAARVVTAHSGTKPQLHRSVTGQGREAVDAVSAPILRSGTRAGTLIAFDRGARPGLVRATGEAARWVSTQLELAELEASRAALAEAEVKALRAQISPHFIYNALTAIASFIHTDPAKARELVRRVRRLHALQLPPQRRLHDRRRGAAQRRRLPAARTRPLRRPARR